MAVRSFDTSIYLLGRFIVAQHFVILYVYVKF